MRVKSYSYPHTPTLPYPHTHLLPQFAHFEFDHTLVQFLEQGFRFAQLLARRELAGRPARLRIRQRIDQRLVCALALRERLDVKRPREISRIAELPVQVGGRERQMG